MSDTTTSLETVAHEAYGWLELADRADGNKFTRLRDGAPEWISELVYHAHGGDFLPDDWRYEAIASACEAIASGDGYDVGDEWADSYVDVYTNSLLSWLSSNLQRQGYVDEAVEEFGWPGDRGITGAIAMGQYMEAREVFGLVRQKLEERLEDLGEA